MAAYTGVCFTTITVYTSPSSFQLADIYSDSGMTVRIPNPFPCFGNYTFYAAAGQYVIQGDFTKLFSRISAGTLWQYSANTLATSGYPGNGGVIWDNATQTSATHLIFSHLTDDGLDIDLFLSFVASTNKLVLQDADASANFQKWTVSGAPTNTNAGTATSYWTVPVTLTSSGGTGTTGFSNNHRIIAVRFT